MRPAAALAKYVDPLIVSNAHASFPPNLLITLSPSFHLPEALDPLNHTYHLDDSFLTGIRSIRITQHFRKHRGRIENRMIDMEEETRDTDADGMEGVSEREESGK